MKMTKRIAAMATCAVMTFTSMVGMGASAIDNIESDFISNAAEYSSASGIGQSVDSWAYALLHNSSTYGQALTSSTWYNSVSDVELLARIIYTENETNTVDQTAVAWVIINRRNYGNGFPSTYRGIVTQSGQFESLTSSRAKTAKSNTDNGWCHATWLACALLSTTSTSDYMSLFGKPYGIDNQLFMYRSVDATFGLKDGYLTINGNRCKNAAYAGVRTVSNATEATKFKAEDRNIFYNYYYNYS